MAKILFVVPTEKMKEMVYKTIEEHETYYKFITDEEEDFQIEVIVNLSADIINNKVYNADIFVARALTAQELKKQYRDIPIVEIPITATDVVLSLREMQEKYTIKEPVALIGFSDISHQADNASKICNTTIKAFNYYRYGLTPDKLSTLLDDLFQEGFRYVIGGLSATRLAAQKGFISMFIESGRESIWLAITQAKHIARIRRMERERAAYFETILNYSREGIISTDINNKVIHINSSAEKILNDNTSVCVGSSLEKVIPDPRFTSILYSEREYSDEVFNLKNYQIVLNKIPIPLGNEVIGNVITFQNVINVQNTEIKIRNKLYKKGFAAKYSFSDIIGESEVLKESIKKAKVFAEVPSNILIVGETGTGKELFSQSIHNYSKRKKARFVAVNCAAIPENLMESEFFGYVGGAFTGASKEGKAGFFELAHEGTIFLDEISEIPLNLQGRLLRIIQESEIRRIGDDKIIPINVRIICATNKDLKVLVSQGKFREDLYYRLSVLKLNIPSLRERGRDIIILANNFIKDYSRSFDKNNIVLSDFAQKIFLNYKWEGNVRELGNICEQLVVLNETGIISEKELLTVLNISDTINKSEKLEIEHDTLGDVHLQRKQFEKDLIIQALKQSDYNKSKAAELLHMNRSTLWRKLKEYNIEFKITM